MSLIFALHQVDKRESTFMDEQASKALTDEENSS